MCWWRFCAAAVLVRRGTAAMALASVPGLARAESWQRRGVGGSSGGVLLLACFSVVVM